MLGRISTGSLNITLKVLFVPSHRNVASFWPMTFKESDCITCSKRKSLFIGSTNKNPDKFQKISLQTVILYQSINTNEDELLLVLCFYRADNYCRVSKQIRQTCMLTWYSVGPCILPYSPKPTTKILLFTMNLQT